MNNKRQISKYLTLNKITEATKAVIIKKGIIELKTIDVANKAKIAHVTLFAHFRTKDLLVSEVCQIELKRIQLRLKEITNDRTIKISELLEKYFLFIAENEDF